MDFYDTIIAQTIEKIVIKPDKVITSPSATPTESSRSYMLRVQYRGRETDNLVRQLNKVVVPIRTVLTLRKLNTVLPSLKTQVSTPMRSRVVYHIQCPGCQASYVGSTIRHLQARIAEHRNRGTPVGEHFYNCIGDKPCWDDVKILCTTTRSVAFLLALEALHINEKNPMLNTRDDFRNRTLTLRF